MRRALLAWYLRHRREMPWRNTRDPYRIWVSEVMLQQTQVATATPYYERFVDCFPDIATLADAPLDDVLTVWSGLGYYRRARFLHEAAQVVARDHGGRVPEKAADFSALPGVGRYTVGAVLSISFGAYLPVLDGNVARVLSRWTALPLQAKRPADAKKLWELAEAIMPPAAKGAAAKASHPGDWNQALMELGATVCTPRSPNCPECPVRAHCKAHELGTPEAFPPVAARRASERVRRAVAVLTRGARILVTRREGSLLEGMWEPPGVELDEDESAAPALDDLLRTLGVRANLTDTTRRVRHTITHHDIEVEVWTGECESAPMTGARDDVRWADPAARALALTALTKKLVAVPKEKRVK